MVLDFQNIEETVIPHFKGGEGALAARRFEDGRNRILFGRLEPGCTIGYHTHDTSSEIILIRSGTGKVLMDGEYEAVKAGDVHYCPQGHSHSLINDSGDSLTFFAVVPEHGR